MSWPSRVTPAEAAVTAIIVGLLLVFGFSRIVFGDRVRDVVFVCPGHHDLRSAVDCANKVYFNGDWHGASICHGNRCWAYTDLFPEAK